MSQQSFSFVLITFWLGGIALSSCEVILVSRNQTDSFLVGKDGCKNNANVCPTSAFCRMSDGFCQCKRNTPTYRTLLSTTNGMRGMVYGCVSDSLIGLSSINERNNCLFTISNVIPFIHNGSSVKFSYDDSNVELKTCRLVKAWTKTPNTAMETELEWMNDSYVGLNVSDNSLHFKWLKPMPELQGTIIYFSLKCENRSGQFKSCLGGKVLGTWLAANPFKCNTDTSWQYRFDKKGWTKCSSNKSFITGFYRNNRKHGHDIYLIESAKCCRSVPAFSAKSAVCKTAKWSKSLKINNAWSHCPQGYFLNGLYRNDRNRLGNIEYAYCCRPKSVSDKYRSCYDEDIAVPFNDVGWSDCSTPGYYITGFYRGPGGDGIDNIDKFRCCQMTMELTALSIEPKTLKAGAREPATISIEPRPTTRATNESEGTTSTSSKDENDYNLNILAKIVIGVLVLLLLVIIVLAIVVRCLWKKQQSNQDRHLEDTEMPNIDKHREENPEYKVDDYEEVGPGRENKGASITNNEHASDVYAVPDPNKNYTSLRRDGREDSEKNYQSLMKN